MRKFFSGNSGKSILPSVEATGPRTAEGLQGQYQSSSAGSNMQKQSYSLPLERCPSLLYWGST